MRKPNRNYYGTQPNKPIYKTKPRSPNSIQSVDSNTHNNNNGNISYGHEPIVNKKYWPPSLTDIIAFFMLLVTGALAWFTFGLYKSATEDSKTSQTSASAANQSAAIAQQTLNEIKDYNTKSLAKQQAALEKADQSNKSNFNRINESLKLQDSSLKETQKQFKIQNEPYLEIANLKIVFASKGFITLSYNIKNLNPTVAKVFLQADTLIEINVKTHFKDDKNISNAFSVLKIRKQHFYLNKDPKYMGKTIEINEGNGKLPYDNLYFVGRVFYTTDINKVKRAYDFICSFNDPKDQPNGVAYNFIYSKNYDIK